RGEHFQRKHYLLDETGIGSDGGAALIHRLLKRHPGDQTRKNVGCVVKRDPQCAADLRLEDDGEDENVESRHKERMSKSPENAKSLAGISVGYFPASHFKGQIVMAR